MAAYRFSINIDDNDYVYSRDDGDLDEIRDEGEHLMSYLKRSTGVRYLEFGVTERTVGRVGAVERWRRVGDDGDWHVA